MPRIVITPVGTSLRETALCWNNLPRPLENTHSWGDIRDNDGLVAAFRQFRKDLWGTTWETIANRFDQAAWNNPTLRRLSAELASLKLIDGKVTLGPGDFIRLVHGSADSKVTAQVTEIVLQRVAWSGCGQPTITCVELPGLDASNAATFAAALSQFSKDLSALSLTEDWIYNLTGGYKGAAVILGIEAFRQRSEKGRTVEVYYLFEESSNLIEIGFDPVVGLPNSTAAQVDTYRSYVRTA